MVVAGIKGLTWRLLKEHNHFESRAATLFIDNNWDNNNGNNNHNDDISNKIDNEDNNEK